jgi:hypothetical protein
MQGPPLPPAVRDFTATFDAGPASGATKSVSLASKDGIFDLVGIAPDQWVGVTVQYPLSETGHRITVEPLNGGYIISTLGTTMLVGVDGTIHFQFRVTHLPGLNYVALHDGPHELGLQFWVLDQQNPGRNPPNLN